MAALASSTGGLGLLVFGPMFLSSACAGALVGGLVGAMTTRGIEKEIANYYDQAVVQGKILVAAECMARWPTNAWLKPTRFSNRPEPSRDATP